MSESHRAAVLSKGRISQKRRTRTQLLSATREMMAEGVSITVANAAERAGISTATAYRYFPDPESLKLEAVIAQDLNDIEDFLKEFKVRCAGSHDPVDRVICAHKILIDFVQKNEPGFRLLVATSHQKAAAAFPEAVLPTEFSLRRLELIRMALEPLRNSLGSGFTRACQTVSLACGPEPYFILKDDCGLNESEILQVSSSALVALVDSIVKGTD